MIKSIALGKYKQFTTDFFYFILFYLVRCKKRRIVLLSDYVILLLCLQLSMGAKVDKKLFTPEPSVLDTC